MPTLEEIPQVPAYGHFSHIPTEEDVAIERGRSDATAGALGMHKRPARAER